MNNIKRKLKIAAIIFVGILVALYGTIFIISKYYLNPTEIKKIIISRVDQKLNRSVTLGDNINIKISWDLTPHVKIDKVTLSNLPGAKQPTMLSVDQIELSIDLVALLLKEVRVTGLKLIKPKINLETVKGVNNWDFDVSAKDDPNIQSKNSNTIYIKDLEIVNGDLSYYNDGVLIDSLIAKSIDIESDDNNTFFKGTIDAVYNKINLKFAGDITVTDEKFKVDIKKLQYGSNDLTGKLIYTHDPKKITGDFNTKSLALDSLSNGSSSASGEYTIPNTKLPTALLDNTDVNITYTIANLSFKKLNLNKTTLRITSKDNIIRATFDPALNVAGGRVNVNFSYNAKGTVPTATFALKTSNVKFDALLIALNGSSPIKGSILDATSNLQSHGTTYSEMVNNLSGRIFLTASPGVYLNGTTSITSLFANVLTSLITFSKKQATTSFTCLVMNFKVNNGIAVANRGVALEASSVNVLGNGNVNLRNGKINFSIIPKNITANSAMDITQFSMAQSVTITGTMSNPQINLSPINLIASGASVATGVATGVFGVAFSVVDAAKNAIAPSTSSQQISPCKIAREN